MAATLSFSATAAVKLSVSPASVSLTASQSQQFKAKVTGVSNTQVTWSLNPAVGAISSTGLYTAPTSVASAQTITVTAVSVASPTASASASLKLTPPTVSVTVAPNTASLVASQTQQLTATVTGSSNTSVSWSLNPVVGTISSTGLYTAPASLSSAQTIAATATSAADPTKSASASLALTLPVSVSVTPTTASVTASQSQQLTATVTGSSNTSITWSLNPAVGTISSAGLYTAPASVSSAQTIAVTATSAADPTKSASASLALTPPVSVSMTPTTASLTASQTQQFTATVTGTTKTGVTWSLSPVVGTISSTGLYTAPASLPNAQSVTVTATSAADPTKSASASLSLTTLVSISMTPSTVSVTSSQTQQFSATVTGASNTGVSWSLNPSVGTLSTNGATAVYTSPSIITTSQTAQVTAASMADSTKTANSLLTLVPAILVSLTPSSISLNAGQSQQFSAAVSGTSNQGVTWSLNPAVGAISSTGLYTAPSTILAAQAVTVTAQSSADPTKSASGVVSLQTTPQLQWTIDANRLTSLSYGGQSFYSYPDYLVWSANFQASDGTITNVTSNGWVRPSLTRQGSNPAYFEHVYNYGQPMQFTVRVTWTTPDSRTLRAGVTVTNNDTSRNLSGLVLNFLPFQTPGPATQYNNNIPMQVNYNSGVPGPVGFLSGQWGSLAFFQDDYPLPSTLNLAYNDPNQTQFLVNQTSFTKNGPDTADVVIHPGESTAFSYLLRFGSTVDTARTLAPDAYASLLAAMPNLVNWPDRRPIAYWTISEGTRRSLTNPRGYLWDPALDTSTPAFSTAVLSNTDSIIASFNQMAIRPQGILIWDLEGQEFVHTFTYVGNPPSLPAIAPDMNAVADQMFAKFTAAGYRIGMTLRPQTFGTGTTLPATCNANPSYWLSDKFVKLDAPYLYRGYWCTAQNTWSVAPATGPGAQLTIDTAQGVLDLLRSKVNYAHTRWGATMFYVDSNNFSDGALVNHTIFRTLAAEFPDCLFIPEGKTNYYFGSTAPFYQSNQGTYATPPEPKSYYPSAFSVINLTDGDTTTNWTTLVNGVKSGDILMFRGWFNSVEGAAIQSIYAAARQ